MRSSAESQDVRSYLLLPGDGDCGVDGVEALGETVGVHGEVWLVVSLQVVVVAGVLLTPLAYVEWRCGWCGGGEVAGALQLAFYHSPKLACY